MAPCFVLLVLGGSLVFVVVRVKLSIVGAGFSWPEIGHSLFKTSFLLFPYGPCILPYGKVLYFRNFY